MNSMWRSAVLTLVTLSLGLAAMSAVWWYRVPEILNFSLMVQCVYIAALGVQFLIARKPWREDASSFILLITVVATCALTIFNNDYFIQHQMVFRPFLGMKVLVALLILACPPKRWVGWMCYGLLALFSLAAYVSWDVTARASLGIQEPYITFIAIGLGVLIYNHRVKLIRSLESEIRASVQLRNMQEFANLLISSQHLLNTPLQKIEILVHLLSKKHVDSPALSRQLDANFDVIRQVMKVMSVAAGKIQWDRLDLPENASQLEKQVAGVMGDLVENARS